MMVTNADARKIIAREYPTMKFRITSKVTIGMRPNYEVSLGFPMLCWKKLDSGKDSIVKIGRMMPNNTIDWDWS